MFGAELLGLIGVFKEIAGIFNCPFMIIGNALAVQSRSIFNNGFVAISALWDTVCKVNALSITITLMIFLGDEILLNYILPNTNQENIRLFNLLLITLVSNTLSSTLSPMSDYIGALRARNVLMSLFIVIQMSFIWVGGSLYHETGAVLGYVLALFMMHGGCTYIALRVFFRTNRYKVRAELYYYFYPLLGLIFCFCIQACLLLDAFPQQRFRHGSHDDSLFSYPSWLRFIC